MQHRKQTKEAEQQIEGDLANLYLVTSLKPTSAEVTAGFWQTTNHPFLTTYLAKSSCLWVPIYSVLLAAIQLRIGMELCLWEEHMDFRA